MLFDLVLRIWWEHKGMPWLKKYRYTIIAIIALFITLYVCIRASDVLIEPTGGKETLEAEELRRYLEAESDKEIEEAQQQRDRELEQLVLKHVEEVEKFREKQKEEVEKLKDDPEGLNKYLLDTGRHIRGE